MRLHALRGAITVEQNDREQILEATAELMGALLERNRLEPADVVNCIFTMTDDLNAEFPAVAARAMGFDRVPLLCVREIDVPGAMPRVIRVLVQYHAGPDHEARHVYLREARALRTDLESAQ
ncbi:MAG: chorismate mutase [Solirubrobacteraceae bacterium]|jgi:chorismate mutase|nr:chorismate mutase [Solirubrobacteraceae bacterium]